MKDGIKTITFSTEGDQEAELEHTTAWRNNQIYIWACK